MGHGRASQQPSSSARQAIAEEAARILEHQGDRDYAQARRKAAARFRVEDERQLPRNDEIEAALRARQQLFNAASQPETLRIRLEAAIAAMEFLRDFEPRLVGPVLEGTADSHSPVSLHLFSDDELALIDRLRRAGIEFEQGERRVRFPDRREERVSRFEFDADDVSFDVTLFGLDGLREAPLDRIHLRPQRRGTLADVRSLLRDQPRESSAL